jgi:hypothetical protein
MTEEDALKGDPEIQSGTETPAFVQEPGSNAGDEGEQDNAPDNTSTGAVTDATGDNPKTDAPDL